MSIIILVTFPITFIIAYRYFDKISSYKTKRDKFLGIVASLGVSLLATTLLTLIIMFLIYNMVN